MELETKTSRLRLADEEYYITADYVLKLASNAQKLFESSEAHEKRQLLKMTLQNIELKGDKAQFDWVKPFDKIANYASRQTWLPDKDSNLNFRDQNPTCYLYTIRQSNAILTFYL